MGSFFKFSKISKNYFSLFYFFESKRLFFPLFEKCFKGVFKGKIFKGEVFGHTTLKWKSYNGENLK